MLKFIVLNKYTCFIFDEEVKGPSGGGPHVSPVHLGHKHSVVIYSKLTVIYTFIT